MVGMEGDAVGDSKFKTAGLSGHSTRQTRKDSYLNVLHKDAH